MSLHAKNIACNLCQHLTLNGTQEVLVDPWKRHCLYAQIKRVHEFTGMFRGMHLMQSPNVVLVPNTQSNCFHFGMQSIRKKTESQPQ